MKKHGIISLGEVIVDLIATDSSNTTFQRLLGGATVNVAVGVSRHGIPSYYLCKLGRDESSKFVDGELKKEGVDLSFCSYNMNKQICSVYIHLNELGERYFHSYVNETPDEWITAEELDRGPFLKSKLFYFGSGTLFHPIARKTTKQAIHNAREENMQIAFDTNIRLKRWKSEHQCRETILSFVQKADIVKMTEEEMQFLTETETLESALDQIAKLEIPFLFVTKGKDGAYAIHENRIVHVPGIPVKAIDTTGAGDAFMAAILSRFHDNGIPHNEAELREYTEFANKAGALSATKLGSL
ncbi:carbohydrate kinase [Bacillus sp. ISL-35]|uniref:carbohydrate kinase family protein n=1 Tax=Bacillus sp. ISL-35 TaxID=2819122 RepID=UPI001BE61B67|nr:carbohydrate kinase [Bacillus sp. ISL-35]MBT2680499.1 carbohydrate kinase [Bacillus sp. ISL-35]MBT2704207.1 carbohydrate kinase [Chryseobacterium sp. ISL-80]